MCYKTEHRCSSVPQKDMALHVPLGTKRTSLSRGSEHGNETERVKSEILSLQGKRKTKFLVRHLCDRCSRETHGMQVNC